MRTNHLPHDYHRQIRLTAEQRRQEEEVLARFAAVLRQPADTGESHAAIIPAGEKHAKLSEL
jgi:hypothetical protein